jgi:preprotein translocase subunit YajC
VELALPALLFVALYLLLIRPQQKRQKQHQQLMSSLSVGDDVITVGGLHGRVVDLTEDEMDLKVSAEGVILRFQRSSLARVVRDEIAAESDDE